MGLREKEPYYTIKPSCADPHSFSNGYNSVNGCRMLICRGNTLDVIAEDYYWNDEIIRADTNPKLSFSQDSADKESPIKIILLYFLIPVIVGIVVLLISYFFDKKIRWPVAIIGVIIALVIVMILSNMI